jgi:hypothetical protein
VSDIDVVKNATALRCRSMFAAQVLAANTGIGSAALEKFVFGRAQLAPDAMAALVREIFHGRSRWDPITQTLVEGDNSEPGTAISAHPPQWSARA